MVKQCIVLVKNGVAIDVREIKTFKDTNEFIAFRNECEENAKKEAEKEYRKEESLACRLAFIERELHNIQLELAYNRGEITEEEYKNGMVR